MFHYINKLSSSNFVKNVLYMSSGATIAQLINIFFTPIITRIYSPEEYGVLTVYIAIIGIIGLLGSLTYELAIPIAEDDEISLNILFLCLSILVLFTTLIYLILILCSDTIFTFLNISIFLRYKYFIPLGFFVTGLFTVILHWNIRKKKFVAIAQAKALLSFISNSSKTFLGLKAIGPVGLILGQIIGQCIGIGTLLTTLFKDKSAKFKYISFNKILWSVKRYRKFPVFEAPSLIFVTFASQLPVIFLSSQYDINTAGYYGLAFSITFLPIKLIGSSIQQVFYSEIANIGAKNRNKINDLSNKLLKKMLPVGIISSFVFAIGGPIIYSFIFGHAWYEAGIYSRLLTFYMFTHFLFHPHSSIFLIFEKHKLSLILQFSKLVSIIFIFIVANYLNLSSYTTIFIFSVASSIIEIIQYLMVKIILLGKST